MAGIYGINSSSGSRTQQVAADIRTTIARGEWPVGSRLPATRELARAYGVGLNTLRRALDDLASEGVVRSQQGSGVYVLAVPEQSSRPLTIGLLVANSEFFAKAIDGVERVTRQAGGKLLLACSEYDVERERQQFRELVASGVDGLILAPTYRGPEHPDANDPLTDPPVPSVYIERTPRSGHRSRVSHITSDLAGGVRSAVTHLVEHGRQRLGYYGSTLAGPSADAYSGFLQAMKDAGLPIIDEAVVTDPGEIGLADYTTACKRSGVDGIFFLRETQAIPMLAHLRREGISVPDDIAIMEFRDQFADIADVSLSGLTLPRNEIGRAAAQLLLRNIELGDEANVCDVHYQPKMVLRESCGAHEIERSAHRAVARTQQ
jgi:DNA-binding LacI/PurR family transcriptional regulator